MPAVKESHHKRLRTRRACDYCREHRIRCEYSNPGDTTEACEHCHRYGIACQRISRPPNDHRPRAARPSATPAQQEPSYRQGIEPGYLGPTNLSQQIRDHCITTLSGADRIRSLEQRLDVFSHAFEGYQDTGRLIGRQAEIGESARRRTLAAATYSRVEERLMRELGSETILTDLMTTCQHAFIPLFPAVSVHESLGSHGPSPDFYAHFGIFHVNSTPPTPLPPVLRLILCAIPAMSRQVPPAIRDGILSGLNTALDSMDFSLGMGTLARIQLHLLLSVNDGLWRRGPMGRPVYAATRMAMGLALHRNVSSRIAPVAQLQRRSRIWGACIIADRWITLRLGQMPSIDLAFADAPWPSPGPDHIPTTDFGVIPCFRYHLEMTKLADLLGRAYLATGTPFGLKNTDDFALLSWQMDFESWQAQLPETWPYSYRLDVPQARPILDLLSIGPMYTFAQPILWPVQPIPDRVTYRPPAHFLGDIERHAMAAVDWASGSGEFYLDTWSMLFHPFVCGLIVLSKSARSGNFAAAASLDKGITLIREWAEQGESPQFVTYKRGDIIKLVSLLQSGEGADKLQSVMTGSGSLTGSGPSRSLAQ